MTTLPLPLPLTHESFSGNDFDPAQFLQGRRHLGLDELRMELRAYLATLRHSLISVINDDYEHFISLSLGLRRSRVPLSLSSLLPPVMKLHTQIGMAQTDLLNMRSELELGLSERSRVREQKGVGRRMIELDEAVERVERLLRVGEGGTKGETGTGTVDRSHDSLARRLERIAGEYNQLLYLVNKAGPELPFVVSLQPRIAKVTTALQLDLSTHLTSLLHVLAHSSLSDSSLSLASSSTSALDQVDVATTRESLVSLLRTYASLGSIPTVEEKVRIEWIRPWCARAIRKDMLLAANENRPRRRRRGGLAMRGTTLSSSLLSRRNESEPQDDEEGDPLEEVYETLLDFIEDSNGIGLLLNAAETTLPKPNPTAVISFGTMGDQSESNIEEARQQYAFLSKVIWDEMGKRLESELGAIIFAAGRPDVFHHNYLSTTHFITHLESLCPSLDHLDALRQHPTTVGFLKRWQLPVYFQLRFGEIVKEIERVLESPSLSILSPSVTSSAMNEEKWEMNGSDVVWRAIERCWDSKVWVAELSPRFWRLTLQLLSRYRTWLDSLTAPSTHSARPSLELAREKERFGTTSSHPTRASTPTPSTTMLLNPEEIAAKEDGQLRLYSVMVTDVTHMERSVRDLFARRIESCLGFEVESDFEGAGEEQVALQDLLTHSLTSLTALLPPLASQIITLLTARALDPLKHVKSIANQARASTRKPGSTRLEPSFFVGKVFKDVRMYVEGVGRGVDDGRRNEWVEKVVESVVLKYTALLVRQKEIDDSLRQLKKGRQGASSFFSRSIAASASTATTPTAVEDEDDRVRLQMQTDVEALGLEATALGVEIESNEAFKRLRAAC